ncbi:MAG: YqgE/AlgH family protein [Bacteroidetes bacterium]|nr:YqgE/AlgH family protein [Bacteroidota bacterium]
MVDSYFKRAVVLLSEHDDKGTLGFILNKPTDVTLNEAVDDFPEFEYLSILEVPLKPIHYSTSIQ